MSDEDKIKALQNALWECRCHLISIRLARAEDARLLERSIRHATEALGMGKEAQA